SNASLRTILQQVPADAQQQVQQQYASNIQSIASAQAGVTLASNLAGFVDPTLSNEISTYGNAATQLARADNALMVGELGLTGIGLTNSITAASDVAGASLAIYNLIQGGPSSDQVILDQLKALGTAI